MVNREPILGDIRVNVTDNLGKYEVYNGETWVIMENYDTINSLKAEISGLKRKVNQEYIRAELALADNEELKQQVAFLEDWRDTWSPTIKQLMNINVKVNDE